ncbi:ccr4-associated factor [Spraguea lophii 42_110]|uniref:poly(A)-specific ribonuclease n=1 Tax=Spraguea lophii (strain 42_110) TaxID=1358809 RepID=S7W8L0_SPRLO|nr:ccr4-associated factor [Spraguea lophii 42_110]
MFYLSIHHIFILNISFLTLMQDSSIINVWEDNLSSEILRLSQFVKKYNVISMDTEFPGVVAKPLCDFSSSSAYTYQQIRCNVQLLKLIQIGISLSDEYGNRPIPATFQFNFNFDIETDMYSKESIDLLIQAKINFKKHKINGIKINDFIELLITTGILMNEKIKWVSFHSSSDFGYIIRAIIGNMLPVQENIFFYYLHKLFPTFYDIKYLIWDTPHTKKGLQEIADDFKIRRYGTEHQAGSDALLTLNLFFHIKRHILKDEPQDKKCRLFGIEATDECILELNKINKN